MSESAFQEYLKENKVDENTIEVYLTSISEYEKFLQKENLTLETVNPNRLVEYTEYLVSKDKELVLTFLRALINYANFTKKFDFIVKTIDIAESFNAMENLYERVAEKHGEKTRDEIFKDMTVPPLGIHPEKKPEFTKIIMKRMEEKLGEEKTIDLLSPCLHGRPPDDIEGDKKKLKELGIDGFLKWKHDLAIKRLEKHRDDGTLEFAQYVDDEVVEFIRKDQSILGGIREGNIIYQNKIPYQIKKFLEAQDDNEKRFHICYCPWIRGAIKDGTEDEVSKHFCHCSAGWFKLYWDKIFDKPVKADPIKSALYGDHICKIAIHVPEDEMKKYIKEN
ncbi:MAG: hypothetical protein EAX90_15770 [Candidatus Heimdallarchaeota archaeon]|nr:hypothetical protein [Candidatus Heimdallarchaeota archaeon]